MLKQITEWNTVKKIWMVGEADLFSQQFKPFSGRWPISGMMRNGQVFGLQMQEQLTKDSECLLLRSPIAVEGAGGAVSAEVKIAKGHYVMLRDQIKDLITLPTPAVAHIRNHDEPIEDYLGRRQDYLDGKSKGMPGASLGVAVRMEMLMTPVASEGSKAPSQQSSETKSKTGQVWLSNQAKDIQVNSEIKLLPTPNTMEHREIKTAEQIAELKLRSPGGYRNLREEVINEAVAWGKFEPVIRRWEATIDRPAPLPTKPDGKDDGHRLSADFVEWMMGLPEGWVCDPEIGLKRVEQLKALGNGVVPQQAELALRLLIDDQILEQLGK